MHGLVFTPQAFNDYLEWLADDKKIFKKLMIL
jgi:Txe/YoeB family toxin of Txe-Axe toxin-antitoxin module